jgi:hypothetical protein
MEALNLQTAATIALATCNPLKSLYLARLNLDLFGFVLLLFGFVWRLFGFVWICLTPIWRSLHLSPAR